MYLHDNKEKCFFEYAAFVNSKQILQFMKLNPTFSLYSVNIGWPRTLYFDLDCYVIKNIIKTRKDLILKLLFFGQKLNKNMNINNTVIYYNERFVKKKNSTKISIHAHFLNFKIFNTREGKIMSNQICQLINMEFVDFLVYKNVQLWRLPYCYKGKDKNSSLQNLFSNQSKILFLTNDNNWYINLIQYYNEKTIPLLIKPKRLFEIFNVCKAILKANNVNGKLLIRKQYNSVLIELHNAFCCLHNKHHSYPLNIQLCVFDNIPYIKLSCYGKGINYHYLTLKKKHLFIWDYLLLHETYIDFETFNTYCLNLIDDIYICRKKQVYQQFLQHYGKKIKNTSCKYIWGSYVNSFYFKNSLNCNSQLICKLKAQSNADINKYGNFSLLCICKYCQNILKPFTFV